MPGPSRSALTLGGVVWLEIFQNELRAREVLINLDSSKRSADRLEYPATDPQNKLTTWGKLRRLRATIIEIWTANSMSDRDTFKYHFKRGNKILHTGITNDLDRREQEHQGNLDPKGHIYKVGNRTTREGAKAWEDDQRDKGKPTGP